MKKVIFRMLAYLVDIIVLGLFLTFVTPNIPLFKSKEILAVNETYTAVGQEYVELNNKYDEILEDNIISEEEYNELKTNFPNLAPSLESLVGVETTKDKVNELIFDSTKNKAIKADYDSNKLSLNRYIFEFIATILYFGVLQFVLKGQTLGKKLFRLFVVNDKDEVPDLKVFLIRSLFTSTIIISVIHSILTITLSYNDYVGVYKYISALSSFYVIFMFGIVVLRDDCKGLHDIILKTRVKLMNKDNTEYKTLEFKEKNDEKDTD